MGRTIASITQTWQQEEAALKRFQRALRKEDQLLLDELLVLSRLHLAEASYASNLYPLDMYLIAILLELYKQLKALQKELTPEGADPGIKLDSGKEARFLTLLNETLAILAPEAPPAAELPEEASEPRAYTAFEEAP
ncbi:MAG TPA: hypothetical protein PKW57_05635 [Anaerolineaceae bacterium]|nr:hypothetical protein [Anaerolineaceae bacterium]HPS32966.1 hypothetical protein [Anaerolineaceae bacterium]